jgi:hypothetical protein
MAGSLYELLELNFKVVRVHVVAPLKNYFDCFHEGFNALEPLAEPGVEGFVEHCVQPKQLSTAYQTCEFIPCGIALMWRTSFLIRQNTRLATGQTVEQQASELCDVAQVAPAVPFSGVLRKP